MGGWQSPLTQGDVGPIEFCWIADDKGHPLGAASDQAAHLDLYLKGHLTLLISASTTHKFLNKIKKGTLNANRRNT